MNWGLYTLLFIVFYAGFAIGAAVAKRDKK